MDAEVAPGALIEVATPSGGVDRRAFGEFTGPGGELASYAFGWITDAHAHADTDDHDHDHDHDHPAMARITIGIGAGNPGGGTFHANVIFEGDGHSFSLTDEPFEDVPEGGPDLTATQARAHEDLRFIWWVADHVMEHDPRARWMRHWLTGTPAITTPQVHADEEPVLLVVNDTGTEPALWQLIGRSSAGDDGSIVHLHHAVDKDPTLADVLDLAPGESAYRERVGAPWTREPSTASIRGRVGLLGRRLGRLLRRR